MSASREGVRVEKVRVEKGCEQGRSASREEGKEVVRVDMERGEKECE